MIILLFPLTPLPLELFIDHTSFVNVTCVPDYKNHLDFNNPLIFWSYKTWSQDMFKPMNAWILLYVKFEMDSAIVIQESILCGR